MVWSMETLELPQPPGAAILGGGGGVGTGLERGLGLVKPIPAP